MSATAICDNPRCTCPQCTCAECRCGATRLGDLERRVMEVLWAQPGRELTIREVVDVLGGYAYTTVATVSDRLCRKGLVRRRTEGRLIRLSATDTRDAHTAIAMHEALAATSDPDAALVRFAQTVSRSEAAVLRRALDNFDRMQRRTSR